MNEEINNFVRENDSKVISIELEFGTVHNIIACLHAAIKSNETTDDLRETLIYCNTSLIFRTIDKFPQCAFIYYRVQKEALDRYHSELETEYEE